MNHHHLFPSLLTGMLLAGMCLFVSCTDAESTDTPAAVPGTLVEVPLRVSAEAFAEGTPSLTRGTYVSDSDEDNTIKNIWVLQFAGTTDDAALLGAQYIEDYTSATIVKLIASTAPNRILVIANTFNPTVAFLSCATMADVKALARTIPDEREASATSTPGSLACVHYDGNKYYVTMNGSVDMAINEMATIALTLKRNVAKVNVIVTNTTTGDETVTLQSVTLMNVPDKFFYYTNYEDKPDLFPVAGTYKTITYTPTPWDEGRDDPGSNTRKFTFYLPENLRGETHDTEATPATQVTKEMYSPADATKAYILGTYYEGGTVCEVSYTYVLGADLVRDCNLSANHVYTYTITLDKLGSPEVDYRVGAGSLIDFRKQALANSYIINPSTALGAWTTVRIPLQRIYDFWGNRGYEDVSNNALLENCSGWHADVIWSDVQLTNDLFEWTINSGATYKDYVEFKIRQGLEGNIVFGVHRYTDGSHDRLDQGFLWSWHLWVTDYKPQQAITNHYQPVEGQYVYPVTGGDVHRYNNTIFNTGIYKEKFIMDRNLGARSIDYVGSYGAGNLYYQFGRKDPFPGNVSYKGSDEMPDNATIAYSATGASNANVPYSVNHPRTYITGTYWTTNDKYNPSSYWQDPYVKTDAGKSIFDPCPPGWRVPKSGTWDGFNTTTFVWNSPKATGRNYRLNGTDVTAGTAFYPASGYRSYSNGSFNYDGSDGLCWSSSPYSQTYGYCLYFNSSSVFPSSYSFRANGFPVRCIAE